MLAPHEFPNESDPAMTETSAELAGAPRSPVGSGSLDRRTFLKTGVLAAGGLAVYAGEIERHWIDVHHVTVRLPNLPEAFRGFRIAHMADFHYGEYTEPTFLRSAVRAVNALRPDLIALTGDFVSSGPMARRISRQKSARSWQGCIPASAAPRVPRWNAATPGAPCSPAWTAI